MCSPGCVVALSLAAALSLDLAVAQVPSPREFFGHEIGADYKLVNYTDMVRYFRAVAANCERTRLVDIGATSYGQRMCMAVITSPANHARIDELRSISRTLAHPYGIGEARARELARRGKAVVWIDGGLHATEAVAGQNIIELVWRMSAGDGEEVRRILDEVVLLVAPANPDGYELVANAYMATRSTRTPVLYQRYVGHDNNRDFYACNQVEAQNISRVFYREWCPQVMYNHHQSAPRGTILYTPPFRDPFNYQIDPLVVRGIEIVSAHMNHRFALEDKPGVISRSGASYSAWWNGGLRSTTYFHNMIGILTEVFGRPEPTPLRQPLARRLPSMDYPQPVASQTWHARQTIEYLQTANFALLDYAAKHGEDLQFGIWRMASRAIAKGRRDHWTVTPALLAEAERREDDSVFSDPAFRDPRAYVLPVDQPDWSAAVRLARMLWHGGIEILRANEAFPLNGRVMPAGSLVIRCDQPYRAHLLDMMEPQWHPDDTRDGKPVPPYDAAGWTMSMQTGARVERAFEALDGPFVPVDGLPPFERRELPVSSGSWLLDPRDLHTIIAVNRLLKAGCRVESCAGDEPVYRVPVTSTAATVLGEAARSLGVRAVARQPQQDLPPGREIRPVRVGLFDVFGGHMATGWDRWLLEQFEFPVQTVWGERVQQGDLRRDFDVLIFHTGMPGPRDLERARTRSAVKDLDELRAALPPFEDWSDLEARAVRLTGDKSLPALREFVAQGGTLLVLGREVDKAVRHFSLPIKTGTHVPLDRGDSENPGESERATTRDEYYVPGSLLAIEVDTDHELARGAPRELAAMMYRTATVLEVRDPTAKVDVVAAFRGPDPLLSGWAIGTEFLRGKAGVLCAHVGKGRVVLYGIDATYRGQSLATARLFFQGVLTAGERE